MLNLKKVIASIAAATVALSSVAFASTYADVTEDSNYYEAVESLSKLGVVKGYEEDGAYNYKPEQEVTRAEMAALIARILGNEETASGQTNTVFTDVTAEHWASGYVAQASDLGIVNGYGDGTFGPEDPVKYEQAVKMVMVALGYEPYAQKNGAYPTGYLSAATRYNVAKGVSNAVVGTNANRGTIAQLLANAIDTPIMAQSKWGNSDDIEYTIYDGTDGVSYKTLMSENLGVVKLKGVVTENTVTNISAAKDIDTTEDAAVKITITGNFDTNNKDFAWNETAKNYTYQDEFLVGDTDAEEFIGKAVVFYVVENEMEDLYEIISIAADGSKNDSITFTLDQFDKVEKDTAGRYTTLKYFKNATDRTSSKINLENTATVPFKVVYNNVGGLFDIEDVLDDGAGSGFVKGNGQSKNGGSVTLIDYNGTAGYDIAFIEVAATAVVKKVTEDAITFKKAATLADLNTLSEIELDEEDETKKVVITKDGEVVDAATLVEWDVLSVIAANDAADYIEVEVISAPVVGTVGATFTSKTSDGGLGYVIDGKKYDVALGAYEAKGVEVGEGGTFYVDKYGKIAAFNEDSALATGVAGNYGFVTKAIVEDDEIDGQTVTVQMLTANGVEIFSLATSVSYKKTAGASQTLKPENATVDPLKTAEQNADAFFGQALAGQVVKYTTNSNGKINNIILADYDDKFESVSSTGGTFDIDNNKVGTTYIDEDAIIFFVEKTGSKYDTDKCQIGTIAELEDNTPYTFVGNKVYRDSKAVDNNIIVIDGGLTAVSPSAKVAVISGVALSEVDGDKIYVLDYIVNGEEASAETVALTDLAGDYTSVEPTVGDAVKVKLNAAGKITSLYSVWDFSAAIRTAGTAMSFTQATAGTREVLDGGAVVGYKESSEEVWFASGKSYKLSRAANVYVVDNTGRSVVVKNGTSANYRWYEALYTTTEAGKSVTLNVDKVATVPGITYDEATMTGNAAWTTAVNGYTDYVFVRTYEDKVVDVVIVKGAAEVTVR